MNKQLLAFKLQTSVAMWQRTSLLWKIMGTFLGTILVVGLLVIVVVYRITGRLLHDEINQRALAIATNLSDAAAGNAATKNLLALHAQVSKYALLDGVAYAFIEDRNGKILAHSLGIFPEEIRPSIDLDRRSQAQRRELMFRGRPVYEMMVPVLEGRLGTVHVANWGDVVEKAVQRAIFPMIGLIGLFLFFGIVISLMLSRQIVQPIIRLRSIADTMSKGNLDTPVGIDSGDEIGELAISLERMRASLKASMVRLSQAKPSHSKSAKEGAKNEQITA
ncbi:MAG TPA: HAMP domain-containing protein [Candidatus Binatia bacterium]|jgi:HAMP domain-containing protein|nr:HAMP domain-containing protein [Candidatus Binatia bacterium]